MSETLLGPWLGMLVQQFLTCVRIVMLVSLLSEPCRFFSVKSLRLHLLLQFPPMLLLSLDILLLQYPFPALVPLILLPQQTFHSLHLGEYFLLGQLTLTWPALMYFSSSWMSCNSSSSHRNLFLQSSLS